MSIADLPSYLRLELLPMLSSDPSFRWCTSEGCDSGQIHDKGHIFTCVQCRNKFCTECEVPWHADEMCRAYQNRMRKESNRATGRAEAEDLAKAAEQLSIRKKKEEDKAVATLKKCSQVCPGCSTKVQKSG